MYKSIVEPKTYFVGSLPGTVQDEELTSYFSRFGGVVGIDVIKKRRSNICRGYGFVLIDLNISESDFLSSEHYFEGRKLTVEPYIDGARLSSKKAEFANRRLFIKNLPPWVTDADLWQYFSKFGKVELAYKAANHDHHRSLNIGCVTFSDTASLDRVMASSTHVVGGQQVKCDRFNRKDKLSPCRQETCLTPNPSNRFMGKSGVMNFSLAHPSSSGQNRKQRPTLPTNNYRKMGFPNFPTEILPKDRKSGKLKAQPLVTSTFDIEIKIFERILRERHNENSNNVRFNLLK